VRAIATRCFSPPLSLSPLSPTYKKNIKIKKLKRNKQITKYPILKELIITNNYKRNFI